MGPFEYLTPQSIAEALHFLNQYGSQAKSLAGGTDLVPLMRQKAIEPKHIVNINNLSSLRYIHSDTQMGLRIGALTTIREIEKSDVLQADYKALSHAAGQLGSVQIRNVATVGGNLCNASPSADMAPILIALSSKVKLASSIEERVIPLEDFFAGPGITVMRPQELMTEIQAPPLAANTFGVYLKYKMGRGEGVAVVSVAVLIKLDMDGLICHDVKIVMGSAAPTPMRAYQGEAKLKGRPLNKALILEAAHAASDEASPIDDIRASSEYRREIIRVITRDAINQAIGLSNSPLVS